MTILIYDTEIYKNDIYDIIAEHLDINFIKVKSKNVFFKEYNNLKPDYLVIIDVSYPEGEAIFEKVTNDNSQRKILVISKELTYNHKFTCEQCDQLFNRKLLLKPLNINQLTSYINNYDTLTCNFSSYYNNFIEILDDILEQFIHYYYDYNEKKILKKDTSANNINEFVRIIQLLDNHNISFEIEDQNIKLKL